MTRKVLGWGILATVVSVPLIGLAIQDGWLAAVLAAVIVATLFGLISLGCWLIDG